MSATIVMSVAVVSQRANWRRVWSATSTLRGDRNVVSCTR
jgi:hypothetical protein